MHIQIAISIFRVTFPWKLCENSIAGSFLTIGLLRAGGGGGGGGGEFAAVKIFCSSGNN